MSGGITFIPGYLLDELSGENLDLAKANALVQQLTGKVDEGAITARELADGSISSDKLDSDISVQLGSVPDGSVTTAKIVNDAVTTGKILDGTILLADLATEVTDAMGGTTAPVAIDRNVSVGYKAVSAPLGLYTLRNSNLDLTVVVDDIIHMTVAMTVEGHTLPALWYFYKRSGGANGTFFNGSGIAIWPRSIGRWSVFFDAYWKATAGGTAKFAVGHLSVGANAFGLWGETTSAVIVGNGTV